jgi:hypothetical protein
LRLNAIQRPDGALIGGPSTVLPIGISLVSCVFGVRTCGLIQASLWQVATLLRRFVSRRHVGHFLVVWALIGIASLEGCSGIAQTRAAADAERLETSRLMAQADEMLARR